MFECGKKYGGFRYIGLDGSEGGEFLQFGFLSVFHDIKEAIKLFGHGKGPHCTTITRTTTSTSNGGGNTNYIILGMMLKSAWPSHHPAMFPAAIPRQRRQYRIPSEGHLQSFWYNDQV